jgi:hypothetical protein
MRSRGLPAVVVVVAVVAVAVAVAGCWQLPEPKAALWRHLPGGGDTRIGPPQPDCLQRGTAESATWVQTRSGIRIASRIPVMGLALGAETTFPIARNDDLRLGPWLQLGGDTLDLVHVQGGLSVVLGGLPDPGFIPTIERSEGALGLALGAGWRGIGEMDHRSDGAELDAKLTFGTRSYVTVYESGNAYDTCDGSMRTHAGGKELWLGHYGPGFAYGHRVFVELERPIDHRGTQIIIGVEVDPVTLLELRRIEREQEMYARMRRDGD